MYILSFTSGLPTLLVCLHFLYVGGSTAYAPTALHNLAGRLAHTFGGGVVEEYRVPARPAILNNPWLTHDYSRVRACVHVAAYM